MAGIIMMVISYQLLVISYWLLVKVLRTSNQ
jgi:hypothetical protein